MRTVSSLVLAVLAIPACARFGYDGAGSSNDGGDATPADAGADAPVSPVSWWDDAQPFRRRVFVHNVGTQRLDGSFQAVLTYDLDTLAGAANDRNTLHLVHQDDFDSAPPYPMARAIFDLPGDPEEMWFRTEEPLLAGATVAHYYLYYGRVNPPAPPQDPGQVFDYFAGFSGADSSIVALTGGEQVAGDLLTLDPGESVRTGGRFAPGNAVDVVLDMPTWTSAAWAGFHETNGFTDTQPWMLWATRGDVGMFQAEVLATQAGVPSVIAGTPIAGNGAHTWTVERYGLLVVFKRDGVETGRVPLPNPFPTALQVRLNNGGTAPVTFDLIRVRVASDPMPEVTLGDEEARP